MEISELYSLYKKSYLVDTDTRKIRKNSLFFALRGENFNANEFAIKALENGASYAIIDDESYFINQRTILVKNSLQSLQKLANYHRNQLQIPIVALTGSNGKTTSKELINAVLKTVYNTTATIGNLNNHIGVPLTILSIKPETEIGIIEMGANHLKEIGFLCSIAQPNFGYITNFGKAHLEGFGGEEGVIEGKSELYTFLKKSNGTIFLNSDDPLQIEKSKDIKAIPFNSKEIELVENNPFVVIKFNNLLIKSHLIGSYNYTNIAAAIAIGNYFKVSIEAIKQAVENYIPSNNRSQLIQKGKIKIILDAYNANPSSMKVALENFHNLSEKSKCVILGDMFELGIYTNEEHQKIAELASSYSFKSVYLIGKAFSTVHVKNAFIFENLDIFIDSALHTIKNNCATILIKGSRGMALERILEQFN